LESVSVFEISGKETQPLIQEKKTDRIEIFKLTTKLHVDEMTLNHKQKLT